VSSTLHGSDLTTTFRAMATDVSVRVVEPRDGAANAVGRARAVFAAVETACTRFNSDSPLMRANARPREWHQLPTECFDAVSEAERAHRETMGLFDPRVLRTLERWGYDRTLAFETTEVAVQPVAPAGRHKRLPVATRRPWRPGLDHDSRAVRLGDEPIDLGGIGKGLAVRWAAGQLQAAGSAVLVEAGGDLYAGGPGPEGGGWLIGVEDPNGGADPVAVLSVQDAGCATSSIRVRHWKVGDRQVHHLIDPRTGQPGGQGMAAVTVVHPDPAWAEVWSKSLFLTGRGGIRHEADARDLAALWVDEDGVVGSSRAMKPLISWEAGNAW
jgi:thiamine biosynthesis lipoprotein